MAGPSLTSSLFNAAFALILFGGLVVFVIRTALPWLLKKQAAAPAEITTRRGDRFVLGTPAEQPIDAVDAQAADIHAVASFDSSPGVAVSARVANRS